MSVPIKDGKKYFLMVLNSTKFSINENLRLFNIESANKALKEFWGILIFIKFKVWNF